MVHILPGRPTGKPDQMSPIHAAVPDAPTGKETSDIRQAARGLVKKAKEYRDDMCDLNEDDFTCSIAALTFDTSGETLDMRLKTAAGIKSD